MVTEVVARDLRAAAKGLCVLAVDGLSLEVAESAFGHASIRPLRSTFPSTSTTAWLTAVTGTDPGVHGAVGMVHRAPGADCVTHLVTGETYAFGSPRTPGNALPRRDRPSSTARPSRAGPPSRSARNWSG